MISTSEEHGTSTSSIMSESKSPTRIEVNDIEEPASIAEDSTVDAKALLRKIDFKILPMLFLIYVAAFLDRVNISNALTLGLPKDLGLTGNQKNVALTIFFVPYVLFEIPSNFLLKRFQPHKWLSGCILIFGIVMLAQGFVKNYAGLLATRFFLGLAEAGIFPGSFYIISFWYRREEAQQRFTVYWCSVLVASAFGGLLASAIANMEGVAGYSSWRWIFILEGIGTILVGIAAFFFVAGFPADAEWLSADERAWIVARTRRDDGEGGRNIDVHDVLRFFREPRKILGGLVYFAMVVPIYSFSYFAPTIIKTLGYTTVQTQLHTVPPVAAALVLALILAYLSDRTGRRFPFVAFSFALTLVGLAILISVRDSFAAKYGGVNLIAMGAFAGGPLVICWVVMNLQGHADRSIGTAWTIGFGNTGGVVATFAFLATDAPLYRTGYTICLVVTVAGILAASLYFLLVWRENRRLKAGSRHAEVARLSS